MIRPSIRQVRAAFTLVELLVVIAIIAILASLITAGAMIVYTRANDAKNANDINQLKMALENFKQKFGMYPPSRIMLYPTGIQYVNDKTNPTLAKASLAVLQSMWKQLGFDGTNQWTAAANTTFIDWSGGNPSLGTTAANWATPVVLDGDQCLVFFLGGIPANGTPGVTGFADSPTNPAQLSGNRIASFYSFQPNRLVTLPNANWPGGIQRSAGQNCFCSYADVYASVTISNNVPALLGTVNGKPTGQPIAYFSTNKIANQYNTYYTGGVNLANPPGPVSDCATIGALPYYAPSLLVPNSNPAVYQPQFQNATTYQIISAGPDMQFGSNVTGGGVIWIPNAGGGASFSVFSGTAASATMPSPFFGMDDRTNFCANILQAGNS